MQPPQHPALHPDQETEELVQFREAWKAEVRQKKAESLSTTPRDDNPYPTTSSQSHTVAQACPSNAGEPVQSATASRPPIQTVRSSNGAVEVYRRAVELERQGQLDDALRLYRQVRKCLRE
jgi:F-box protein 9